MCFALQDPGAWSDVASFNLSEATTPPRHNQAGYTTLLQERTIDNSVSYAVNTPTNISSHDKSCTPFGLSSVTPINSSKTSQVTNGRRRRRQRGEAPPLCDRTCFSLDNMSDSPKKTPTKSLPFTPSQVNEISFSFFIHLSQLPASHDSTAHVARLFFPFPQLCNISGAEHLNLDNPALTSTPVCGQRCLLNTPLHKETPPRPEKENDG